MTWLPCSDVGKHYCINCQAPSNNIKEATPDTEAEIVTWSISLCREICYLKRVKYSKIIKENEESNSVNSLEAQQKQYPV